MPLPSRVFLRCPSSRFWHPPPVGAPPAPSRVVESAWPAFFEQFRQNGVDKMSIQPPVRPLVFPDFVEQHRQVCEALKPGWFNEELRLRNRIALAVQKMSSASACVVNAALVVAEAPTPQVSLQPPVPAPAPVLVAPRIAAYASPAVQPCCLRSGSSSLLGSRRRLRLLSILLRANTQGSPATLPPWRTSCCPPHGSGHVNLRLPLGGSLRGGPAGPPKRKVRLEHRGPAEVLPEPQSNGHCQLDPRGHPRLGRGAIVFSKSNHAAHDDRGAAHAAHGQPVPVSQGHGAQQANPAHAGIRDSSRQGVRHKGRSEGAVLRVGRDSVFRRVLPLFKREVFDKLAGEMEKEFENWIWLNLKNIVPILDQLFSLFP
jgi:hypothetical protein